MKLFPIAFAFLLWPVLSSAQPKNELQSMFKESFSDFYKTLSAQITSRAEDDRGVLIVVWVVQNGAIENMYLANPLSAAQNASVVTALSATKGQWQYEANPRTFILPVVFSKGYPDKQSFPDHFLPPLYIVGYGQTSVKNLHNGNTQTQTNHTLDPTEKTLASRAQKLIAKRKYEKALTPLNILIKRYPLTEDYRNMRLACFQATNAHEALCNEVVFMQLIYRMEPAIDCVK